MAIELRQVLDDALLQWGEELRVSPIERDGETRLIECPSHLLPELSTWLFNNLNYSFGGIVVEQQEDWVLRYLFYGDRPAGWVHVLSHRAISQEKVPSISTVVHAADWHEREAEDLFGLDFEGHPRLGDFVLHDDLWPEGVNPMRRSFNAYKQLSRWRTEARWQPRRIVHEEGAFVMPIGPIFSTATGPVHFGLETVGEDVIRAQPRLFYAYRGLEKIAEGRPAENVIALAERINATSSFAHSLAYCQAVERLCQIGVPPRAQALRIFLAELERLRHHAGAIAGICESTAFAVATSQAAIIEEDLLRLSGVLTGHRYLFGLNVFGGLSIDIEDAGCLQTARKAEQAALHLAELDRMLAMSSSFLDRLEDVGGVSATDARGFGLVGPVARASGVSRDLRQAHPYSGYDAINFEVPSESEGDGYARLRLFFQEAQQSARILAQIPYKLAEGTVRVPEASFRPGSALGWVEAPNGAALHWVRLGEDGRVERHRIITPSFANWHGFRLAAEDFAFQDFPIILATFALSVPENDR
jgi:formate hydrogenlyase subunit 5